MLPVPQISVRQLALLAAILTVGDALLVLPAIPAFEAKQDAWLSGIVGMAAGMMNVLLFCAVGKLYPDMTLVQYNRVILGKWIGNAVSILVLFYFFFSASAHVREIGDFTTTHMMPETPIEAINLLFVGIIVLGVRLGLETIARAGEIFFPWLLLLFVFLFISLIPQIDFKYMQPILENGIKPIIRGSFATMTFPFAELVAFLMIFPYVSRTDKLRKGFIGGAGVGGVVLLIVIALAILVLGPEMTARHIYPSYALAKEIDVPHFLQRVEAMVAILWIVTTYLKITLYVFVFHLGFAQLLGLRDYKSLALPFGWILIVLSNIVAPNITKFNQVIAAYWPLYDLTFSVMLPFVLLGIYFVRK